MWDQIVQTVENFFAQIKKIVNAFLSFLGIPTLK